MKLLFLCLILTVNAYCVSVVQSAQQQTLGQNVCRLGPISPAAGNLLLVGFNTSFAVTTPVGWSRLRQVIGTGLVFTVLQRTVVAGDSAFTFSQAGTGDCYLASVEITGQGAIEQHAPSVITTASFSTTGVLIPQVLGTLPVSFGIAQSPATTLSSISSGWTLGGNVTGQPSWSAWRAMTQDITTPITNTFTFSGTDNVSSELLLIDPAILSPVTGHLSLPNAGAFNGTVSLQLPTSGVNNTCVMPAQLVPFQVVSIPVTNGILTPVSLFSSYCLSAGASSPAKVVFLSGDGGGGSGSITGNWWGTLMVDTGTTPAPSSVIAKIGLTVPNLLTCFMQAVDANALASGATLTQTTVSRISPTQVGRYLSLTSTAALTPATIYTWTYACVPPYAVTVTDSLKHIQYRAQWIVPLTAADVTQVDFSQLGIVP